MPMTSEWIEEVRSALRHLHDAAYLETHSLAQRIPWISQMPECTRGQALRRTLRLAIEELDPGPEVSAHAREARPYQLLTRYCVSQQPMTRVADELGISERQAFRELRRATEALAGILSQATEAPSNQREAASPSDARLRDEVERLSSVHAERVHLNALVAEVVEQAQPLAQGVGARLDYAIEAIDLFVDMNRVMLRQALLNLLSHFLTSAPVESTRLTLSQDGDAAVIALSTPNGPAALSAKPDDPGGVALHLLDSLGIRATQAALPDGSPALALRIPLRREHRILIVDDNEGTTALYQRYLRHAPYQVTAAACYDAAIAQVRENPPDVVVLDVMMPDRDGWEVLQRLRADPSGAPPRVVVCSIINDPHLAAALGADAFLHKPVSRQALLSTLQALLSKGT